MATYNRKQEVENFIISLLNQNFDIKKIELIIVDQNHNNILDEIIKKYQSKIKINWIKIDKIGPSNARNIGIKHSLGEIISFPDDDCEYYPDTLTSVYRILTKHKEASTVLGKVFDRKTQQNIIRNWPNQEKELKEVNFFFLYTCITVFTKNKSILFDTDLGPNTLFGAYEDADYILSLVKCESKSIVYYPSIEVNHPKLGIETMSLNKLNSYGMGFGAFCRKNISAYILFLLTSILTFHLIKLIFSGMMMDWKSVKKRYFSIISRIKGFWLFNKSAHRI